jgi:hypothetical protein
MSGVAMTARIHRSLNGTPVSDPHGSGTLPGEASARAGGHGLRGQDEILDFWLGVVLDYLGVLP